MNITIKAFISKACISLMLLGGLMGCASVDQLVTISGDVSYRERIALPDNARLTVQVKDVSLQDTKAIVVAEKVYQQVNTPQSFEFQIAGDQFIAGHRYSIGARIEVNGKLWFINTQAYSIDVNETQPINVIVNKVGG
ncbi:YbaY family lipoprotein [Shewanella sp. UCD-KL21]|uniref:YbaY family lipoprotein n=1 Tax=Shewanella sp. UCD-KL21 TaxID=1917164 RepID=UPI0009714C51|nr:YbaY family lipoprotein [Shewanella sp. UCD-KL21]